MSNLLSKVLGHALHEVRVPAAEGCHGEHADQQLLIVASAATTLFRDYTM